MCGIVGYIGEKKAIDIVLDCLEKLEYRGYDSAGAAIMNNHEIRCVKETGRLENLRKEVEKEIPLGNIGIGHTRWATHGEPTKENSHPHRDESESIYCVHNGIIENYLSLKEKLIEEGETFYSETDSEVIPKLISKHYNGNLLETVRDILPLLEGSFSLGIIHKNENKIIATKKESPLLIGAGDKEYFLASDASAIIEHTRDIIYPEDGDLIELTMDAVHIYDKDLNPIVRETVEIDWTIEDAQKDGFDHFMLKEIFEQPKALYETYHRRLKNGLFELENIELTKEYLESLNKVYIVACGTAYHAGLVGKPLLEKALHIPVIPDIASEFRYMERYLDEKSFVIIISQSGETADTLAALRKAKAAGSKVLAITNVIGSSIAREADQVLYTWAGPEIAVASTKAYMTQLISIYMIGLAIGSVTENISEEEYRNIFQHIEELPGKIEEILETANLYPDYCKSLIESHSSFYLGRGLDAYTSMEGALKLKEISYIHAESFAAGELKHGTIALIEKDTPVIALATQHAVYDKMISNIKEVRTRGAYVIGITMKGLPQDDFADEIIVIPETIDLLAPFLSVVPTQLIAYYSSLLRGNDVDKPRNLAKSVTVE